MKEGRRPSFEEIADAAMVSRATAYRYFPSLDALLAEASLDVPLPEAEDLFPDDQPEDLLSRLERVDAAFNDVILENETQVRLMLVHALEQSVRAGDDKTALTRRNRRSPLIEAALAPARDQLRPADFDRLNKALAVVLGPEAMVVLKDVLLLDETEAREVTRWAIRALLEAARQGAASQE